VSTQAEDKLRAEDAWFAIVTAEIAEAERLDTVALALLVTALDEGIVTYAVTPFGVTVVVGAPTKHRAMKLGKRLVDVAKTLGAARVVGRLTNKIEEAIPAAARGEAGGG
jgi:hypothetical protein